MPAEYLDLSYIAWQSALQSVGTGWGVVVDNGGPPPSGYVPSTYTARGQALSALLQNLGAQGRANGVRAEPQAAGYLLLTVGGVPWEQYDDALVSPLNCREVGMSAAGRGTWTVTVDSGGEFATVSDAGARYPGRQLISGADGSAKYLAEATVNTAAREFGTLRLRVDAGNASIRVGDVACYIRAGGGTGSAVYLRVVEVSVDEASLPTEFTLTGQVLEPDAAAPVALTKGAFWPGTRGTGNAIVRRIRKVESS